jgi:hypothetical protein
LCRRVQHCKNRIYFDILQFFSPVAAIFAQGTVGKKRRPATRRVTFCDYMQKIRIFARRKFERDKQ